jgi:hypothetical protein
MGVYIIQKINENAIRKQKLAYLYEDYCKCINNHVFGSKSIMDEYGHILKNKDIRELESCKKEYIDFMVAYYTYKNESF